MIGCFITLTGYSLETRIMELGVEASSLWVSICINLFHFLFIQENLEAEVESASSFPCAANPTVYSPPPAASLIGIIGEVGSPTLLRSGSSVVKKSYTSDDELDELDSPMTAIIIENSPVSPSSLTANSVLKSKGGRQVVRYQLLREVWKDSE